MDNCYNISTIIKLSQTSITTFLVPHCSGAFIVIDIIYKILNNIIVNLEHLPQVYR